MNRYLYRQTERFVQQQTGHHPLSAPGDKFGNNSSKAQVPVTQIAQFFLQVVYGALFMRMNDFATLVFTYGYNF
jgi:hypothetical protein